MDCQGQFRVADIESPYLPYSVLSLLISATAKRVFETGRRLEGIIVYGICSMYQMELTFCTFQSTSYRQICPHFFMNFYMSLSLPHCWPHELICATVLCCRGQPPVPTKENEVSNVGVVSNVAIFSLKAKVGKLETEAEKRNNKIQQLEKEKATLTLLNTEARYNVYFI